MARVSSGAWWRDVRSVVQMIDHDVTGPQLTAALINYRSTLSLAMARRLSSAFLYSASKTATDVLASIAVCEQLQAIERLDPMAIADIMDCALAGQVPLSALRARAASIRARLSAVANGTVTSADLVSLCPERSLAGVREEDIEFDDIRDSEDVLVDAACYLVVPVDLPDRVRVEYHGRWCMLASPHIACAKTQDPSHERFVARIRIALALYEYVSVVCSSSYEQDLIDKRVRRPPVGHRVWLHRFSDEAGGRR